MSILIKDNYKNEGENMVKELVLSNKFNPLAVENLKEYKEKTREGTSFYVLPSTNLINQAKKDILKDELEALMGSDVISLEKLAENVLAKELVWQQIGDDQALALIAKVVLRLNQKKELIWFSQLDSLVESIDEIYKIVIDLKKGGAAEFIDINDSFSDREKDIALIYNNYQETLIGRNLIDSQEGKNQAIRILKNNKLKLGKTLIIHAYEINSLQQKFISQLENCFEEIKIYFHYDLDNRDLYKDNNNVLAKFRDEEYQVKRKKWPEDNIADFLFNKEFQQVSENISVTGYFTKSVEIQSVLREVKKLIIAGVNPTEIALISYNLKEYQTLLNFFAKEYQLPLDLIRTSLDREVFINKLLLPLSIKRLSFTKEVFLEFLRQELNWPEFIDPLLLAKFITLSPHEGPLYKWQQACALQQTMKDEEMIFNHDQLNTVAESLLYINNLFNKIPSKGNFSEIVSGIMEVYKSLNMEEYISSQINDLPEEQAEKLYSLWQNFNLFIYQENEYDLWPEKMDFNEFHEIFKRSLVWRLPDQEVLIDQTISVLNPYQAAGLNKKYIYLIGANEGSLPSVTSSWIRGIESDELANLPLCLNQSELLFQKSLFARTVAIAKPNLTISYIVEDFKGEERYISPFVIEVLDISGEKAKISGKIWPDLAKSASKAELQQTLANERAVKNLNDVVRKNHHIEQLRASATSSVYNGVFESEEIKAVLEKKFSDNFTMSTSMLEEYGRCPFAFMFKRVFNVREEIEFEAGITPLKRGLIFHTVLAEFLSNYLNKTLNKSSRDKYFLEIENILMAELENVIATSAISSHWVELEKRRFLYIMQEWLDSEIDLQEEISFRPTSLEQRFKYQLNLNEKRLKYTGFIDRIDKSGDKFIIYDYKSGYPPTLNDIREGIAFQLPLYLLASYDLTGLKNSCGGGYYQLNNFKRTKGMWQEECLSELGLSKQINDCLNETDWHELIDEVIERSFEYRSLMRGGYYPLMPRVEQACSYCPYRDICRLTNKLSSRLEESSEIY